MSAACRQCKAPLARQPTGRPRQFCSDACRVAALRKRQKPHRLAVHFSSKTVEWPTPQDSFDRLDAEFGPFTLDPAATPANAKCARYFTLDDDGLAQEWTGRVFMNPPYGRPLAGWAQGVGGVANHR
jgi:phage N-6-adenine-methyltransferase